MSTFACPTWLNSIVPHAGGSLALGDERLGLRDIAEQHRDLVLGKGRHSVGCQMPLQRAHTHTSYSLPRALTAQHYLQVHCHCY